MTDISILRHASAIWDEHRFELWSDNGAEGVYRRVTLIKSGLLGEVARYYADDYIIWKYALEDVARLRRCARHEDGLMTQRFVFIQEGGTSTMRKSSIMFGLRGFVETHMYTPGSEPRKEIKDLAFMVNAAIKITATK